MSADIVADAYLNAVPMLFLACAEVARCSVIKMAISKYSQRRGFMQHTLLRISLVVRRTSLPLLALLAFLGLGALYFWMVHSAEPFVERLGAVLLIPDYDWVDNFTVIYSFLGWLRCCVVTLEQRLTLVLRRSTSGVRVDLFLRLRAIVAVPQPSLALVAPGRRCSQAHHHCGLW